MKHQALSFYYCPLTSFTSDPYKSHSRPHSLSILLLPYGVKFLCCVVWRVETSTSTTSCIYVCMPSLTKVIGCKQTALFISCKSITVQWGSIVVVCGFTMGKYGFSLRDKRSTIFTQCSVCVTVIMYLFNEILLEKISTL